MRGIFVVLSLFCLLLIQGCVAVQTFPTAARAGDTITLAVGSPDGMTKSNTNISFISDSDPTNPVDVTSYVRAITKIFPDKMSPAWHGSKDAFSNLIPKNSGHGGWLSVIILDLPATLPEGAGYFSITVSPDVTYPNTSTTIEEVQVGIEILPGTGVSNAFAHMRVSGNTTPEVQPLSTLEANDHVLIKPPLPFGVLEQYGAIEIKVNAQIRVDLDGTTIPDRLIRVVFDDQPDNLVSQKQASWYRVGDEFTLNYVSPNASLSFYEARAAIVIKRDAVHSFVGTPSFVSIKYFDASGAEVTGIEPAVILHQD